MQPLVPMVCVGLYSHMSHWAATPRRVPSGWNQLEQAVTADANRDNIAVSMFACYPPASWTKAKDFYGDTAGPLDPLGPMNVGTLGNINDKRVHRFRPVYMALQTERTNAQGWVSTVRHVAASC